MLRMIHILLIALFSLFQAPMPGSAPPRTHSVVTEIRVSVTHQGQTRRRSYTDPESMEAILRYLRVADPRVRAEIAPETFRTDTFEFLLIHSDSTQTVYRQIHDSYLLREGDCWRKIEPKAGLLFPEL